MAESSGVRCLVEVTRQVARRGAEPILMPSFSETQRVILTETPEDRLDMVPEIQDYIIRHVDAMLALQAPENTREGGGIPKERLQRVQLANQGSQMHVMRACTLGDLQLSRSGAGPGSGHVHRGVRGLRLWCLPCGLGSDD